jgi:Phage integrase, N-terminal SAM-like domain
VTVFLADLQAAGRSATTMRSYGMDLLRWFRFLWAVEVAWDQATGVEGPRLQSLNTGKQRMASRADTHA